MLASSPTGRQCIRCAYRIRLRTLQQQRCRRTTSARRSPPVGTLKDTRKTFWEARSGVDRGQVNLRFRGRDGERVLVHKDGGSKSPTRLGRGQSSFHGALREALKKVKQEVRDAPVLAQVAKDQQEWHGSGEKELGFSQLWKAFTHKLGQGRSPTSESPQETSEMLRDLTEKFQVRGMSGLEDRVKYHFYGHVAGSRFSASDIRNQKALADLRYPSEWFSSTRAVQRTIHLHVGPTNSGKTYHALQRLEQAKTGSYAGPLRLLAHEVYSRLNAKGKPCALMTGEEVRLPVGGERNENSYDLVACTVEMIPLEKVMEVAVIDEIQMIGSAERGWAWTQALIGVQAKEVHLCGEARTVPLIKQICASIGEKLEIHEYKRLSPLAMEPGSLNGQFQKLRKGDCIVSFSVMGIHALRKQIEKATGRKVAMVYGSLPPETRAQQARLFNDPNNDYDYLVASDAIGMGLNLAIKRVIFEASSKFNGFTQQTLSIADIKQIGGRAGRFRVAGQSTEGHVAQEDLAAAKGEPSPAQQEVTSSDENMGWVTTLERFDFPIIRAAMGAEPEPIQSAGLLPPTPVLERFAGYFPPGTPFSYIITRLHELSQMHRRFHLCALRDHVWLAEIIEGVDGLTVSDRNILVNVPANKSDVDMWQELMPAFARCIAKKQGANIVDIAEIPLEILECEIQGNRQYLRRLEALHKALVAYLWLSYRFAGVFTTRVTAQYAKQLTEEKIEKTLGQFSFSELQRRKLAAAREKETRKKLLKGLRTEEPATADAAVWKEHSAEKGEGDGESDAAGASDASMKLIAELAIRDSCHRTDMHQANDTNFDLGAELEGRQPEVPSTARLEDQSSHIAGSDHFSGAEDLAIAEPELEPEGLDNEKVHIPSQEAEAPKDSGVRSSLDGDQHADQQQKPHDHAVGGG